MEWQWTKFKKLLSCVEAELLFVKLVYTLV